MKRKILVLLLISGIAAVGPAVADDSDIEELKYLVDEMQKRIEYLEARVRQLEHDKGDDDLAALVADAEEITADQAELEAEAEKQRKHFSSHQRTLQSLNPEISFLGEFTYDWTSGEMRDGFMTRGVELSLQSPLDPYTRFKGMLAGHQEAPELERFHDAGDGEDEHGEEIHLGVEEAYMEWVALPLNTRFRVGRFRQQFGTLNRWHPHGLPVVTTPRPLQNIFGHDGLVGLGIGFDWELPSLWASHNGLTLEVVNADNPLAFSGTDWNNPEYLLRHTGFFDIDPDTYLEIGLNIATGPNEESEASDTTVASMDFNFLWEPTGRAHYRNFELRGEYFWTDFERAGPDDINSDAYYAYLSCKLTRRWAAGLGYEYSELPSDRFELLDPSTFDEMEFIEGLSEQNIMAFLTYWQSEFVRLRLQYQHSTRDYIAAWGQDEDDRVSMQVTFAAGPHKHESY